MPTRIPSRFSADAVDLTRPVVEGHAGSDYHALMTEALHKILIERELLSKADTDRAIAALEAPNLTWGARIVAQARRAAPIARGCCRMARPPRSRWAIASRRRSSSSPTRRRRTP